MNAATETVTTADTDLCFDMFEAERTPAEQAEQAAALEMFRVASSRSLQVGNLRGVTR